MDLKLEASGDDLSQLWHALDHVRKGTRYVAVEVTMLKRVLLDHAKMMKELEVK